MAPGDLERILAGLPRDPSVEDRVILGTRHNEDAAVVRLPGGQAIVQTLDFFTPIVNDPYQFGRIAAANALSDVYAMGGTPWCAMNIVCFPVKRLPESILTDILRGGSDALREAGTALVGGHSVEDDEIKYGLSVTGLIEPDKVASNTGLRPGDRLLLTKPLGTGILATAVKASWPGWETFEEELYRWASRLNKGAGRVIRELGLKAATDVTGFGLGGHCLEMAGASGVTVALDTAALPVLPGVLELAGMGLVPEGSHANRAHCHKHVRTEPGVPPVLSDVAFDAQTSGGMLLAVPPDKVDQAVALLAESGDPAYPVGEVLEPLHGGALLVLR